jgi:hypothetical protein
MRLVYVPTMMFTDGSTIILNENQCEELTRYMQENVKSFCQPKIVQKTGIMSPCEEP